MPHCRQRCVPDRGVYDGTELRHLKRSARHVPEQVRVALDLGESPGFDGPKCVDCGRRYCLEVDHQQPFAAGGPTSVGNSRCRCPNCHEPKTHSDLHTLRRRRIPLPLPP
jgi:hypothetical protein